MHTLKKLEKTSIPHELGDDVNGLLHGAHGVELNELGVPEFLHYLRLGKEVLGVHGTGFEGLDGHGSCVVPEALPDFAKLALAQLPHELERRAVDLPLVARPVAQAFGHRFLHLENERSGGEATAQSQFTPI